MALLTYLSGPAIFVDRASELKIRQGARKTRTAMNANRESHQSGAPDEVSLVRGGPFYRVQQALRLVRPDRWNLARRIVVLLAIGWLPLFVITAISNPHGLLS